MSQSLFEEVFGRTNSVGFNLAEKGKFIQNIYV